MIGDEQGWVVESILGHKTMRGGRRAQKADVSEYKVRWEPRGKERLDDTWEDVSNLLACDWAIEQYWAGFESAAEASKKGNRAPAAGATEAQEVPTQQSIYDKYLAGGAAPSAALWDKALAECAVISTSGTKRRRRT